MIKLLIIFSLLFTGQIFGKDFEGNIKVGSEPLRVKRTDGMKSSFYRGQYFIQLNLDRKIGSLRILRNEIWTDVEINIPRDLRLPTSGDFFLPASRTGQTFNISGTVSTETSRSENIYDTESCIYYDEDYVCRGHGRRRRCRWERVAVRGEQDVEYYYLNSTKNLRVSFDSKPATAAKVNFSGVQTSRKKIYEYRSQCY